MFNAFERRFPYAGLFLLIAIVLAIPIYVLSVSYKTNTANYAAKGSHGGGKPTSGGATLNLVMVTDKNLDGLPNYGDVVTFNITTTATNPFVHLRCQQNGTTVAQGWAGYFDGALGGRNFGLTSPSWTDGAADCTATVEVQNAKNQSWSVLGSTSFHVNP